MKRKSKIERYKKIKEKKTADIGNYEMVEQTYIEAPDGDVKTRYTKPIKIKLTPRKGY